jgi:AraC family transcriptional regulator
MADFDARPLLASSTLTVWDVVCRGERRHRSEEECASGTHLVFPYRGAYVHHVGRAESVAEANTLGFSSHSHFSAAFKQAYGQTPSAFQRSARR